MHTTIINKQGKRKSRLGSVVANAAVLWFSSM